MENNRTTMINEMMQTIAKGYADSFTEMFPMGAIYIYSIRDKVYKGDKVAVNGENLVKATDTPTHEITALKGTLAGNKLCIELRNMETNELKIIDL